MSNDVLNLAEVRFKCPICHKDVTTTLAAVASTLAVLVNDEKPDMSVAELTLRCSTPNCRFYCTAGKRNGPYSFERLGLIRNPKENE